MKTKRILGALLSISLFTGVGTAFADILSYKTCDAKAELNCDFHLSWLGSDEGEAITKELSATSYSVAARIERWSDKSTMADYKYDGDSDWAEVDYTWSDVYCYQSRHSIDNSTNTVEYTVKSFKDVD